MERIEYRGPITAFLRKSDWNRQVEEPTWSAPGHLWHREFRPRHFTLLGARKYGYAKRKGEDAPPSSRDFWRSYMGRKKRLFGHQRPLEFSGEMKAETARGIVRATSKGMKVIMWARKANWRHPNSDVRMADELRTIAADEAREMVRAKERAMVAKLREIKTVIRKTVGGT